MVYQESEREAEWMFFCFFFSLVNMENHLLEFPIHFRGTMVSMPGCVPMGLGLDPESEVSLQVTQVFIFTSGVVIMGT